MKYCEIVMNELQLKSQVSLLFEVDKKSYIDFESYVGVTPL